MDKICGWFVSREQPECGAPAPARNRVTVRGKLTKATVYLCDDHKAQHDDNAARLRTETATASR